MPGRAFLTTPCTRPRRRTLASSAPKSSQPSPAGGACSGTANSSNSDPDPSRPSVSSRPERRQSDSKQKSAGPAEKTVWRQDEGLNNSCFVRILFFCRGRTDKVREVEITTQCPECRGDHLVRDYSRAEIVCEDCGLVLDDMIIDEGPEWRAFYSEQRESPGTVDRRGRRRDAVRVVPPVRGAANPR